MTDQNKCAVCGTYGRGHQPACPFAVARKAPPRPDPSNAASPQEVQRRRRIDSSLVDPPEWMDPERVMVVFTEEERHHLTGIMLGREPRADACPKCKSILAKVRKVAP